MDTLNKSNSFRIIAENENLHETFLGIGVFVILIFVVGLVENLCVLYVFIKHKPMPVSNNKCLMWLTLVDIGLTIFGLPLLVGSSFAETWPYGQPVCAMYGFFMTFFGISQIAILDMIAIEKYLIIVKQNRILSKEGKTGTVFIFCCFGFGLMWAVFPLLGWNSFTLEGLQISCSVNWAGRTTLDMSYSLSLMVFAWVVPLVVMLFCYGNIVILLRREARKPFRRQMKATQKKKQLNREKSVAITVFFIIVAFIASWMPYSVVSLVTIVGDPGTIPPTVTMVPALLAKSSIIWNPVIYFVRHNDFRRACLKLLPVCCIWTKFLQCDRSNRLSTSGNTTKQKIINGNIAVRYLCEPRTPQNDEIKYRLVVSLGSRELTLTDGSQSDTKSLLTLKSKCIETNV